jgi:tRNA threonylcarbamoyladenosine dehydratase
VGLSEDYLMRFGGVARLYGVSALNQLAQAHFAVIGLGGVGSWAAEALARSGVGELTLIDLDDVCMTNTNRQLQALVSNVGLAKNAVLTRRLLDINPELRIHSITDFLNLENITSYIDTHLDVVIDAMDSANIKAGLIAYASARKIRLITVGSSGGKKDPQKVTVDDLARTEGDPMMVKIRARLYRQYKFARDENRKFRVDAIYSSEQMVYPKPDGSVCMEKQIQQNGVRLDCTGGFGSSVMVTGTFGFVAASRAIERYLQKKSALAISSAENPQAD